MVGAALAGNSKPNRTRVLVAEKGFEPGFDCVVMKRESLLLDHAARSIDEHEFIRDEKHLCQAIPG